MQAKVRIFLDNMRPKVISLLRNKYGLREADAADCFQEGSIAMWQNFKDGKITLDTVRSLDSYLFRCCCNHATKVIRAQKNIDIVDDFAQFDGVYEEQTEQYKEKEREITILESLVKQMAEPCHTLIWGHYRHKYTMEQMADMLNFRNGDVAKARKNQCMKKLKKFAQERGLTNQQYA